MKLLDWLFERGSIDPCTDDALTKEVRDLTAESRALVKAINGKRMDQAFNATASEMRGND